MCSDVSKQIFDDEDPTITIREDEYCPICDTHNGHSLSCATFPFNRIEGSVSSAPNALAEGLCNGTQDEPDVVT